MLPTPPGHLSQLAAMLPRESYLPVPWPHLLETEKTPAYMRAPKPAALPEPFAMASAEEITLVFGSSVPSSRKGS
jgi:hypothetical protein